MLIETDTECATPDTPLASAELAAEVVVEVEFEAEFDDGLNTVYGVQETSTEPDDLGSCVEQNMPKYGVSASYAYLAALSLVLKHQQANHQHANHQQTYANFTLPLARPTCLDKFDRVRHFYQGKLISSSHLSDSAQYDEENYLSYKHYLNKIARLDLNIGRYNRINNVMLTGATGFLGCHILAELIRATPYTIHLPIRALNKQEAFRRLEAQYQRYFQSSLTSVEHRIVILTASLAEDSLGLNARYLANYATEIDSIIHCAASTNESGQDPEVELANIRATANLLEFSQMTLNRDFHFISCLGVLQGCQQQAGGRIAIVTEEDGPDQLMRPALACFDAKLNAERLVHEYRRLGVHGSIYRTGNLIAGKQTRAIQNNHQANSLFAQIRAMMEIGMVPDELAAVQVSEVGLTASAIVRLFDKKSLADQTYHIFNPELFNVRGLLTVDGTNGHADPSLTEFISQVSARVSPHDDQSHQSAFHTLTQLWSALGEADYPGRIQIVQKKTAYILASLGFFWPAVTQDLFRRYLDKSGLAD